jgi:hypothetical protein
MKTAVSGYLVHSIIVIFWHHTVNKELEKEVCTFICREKTACIAGDVSGASCQCDSCALPNQLLGKP